jgi:uncharacterized phage-like protein YoqJ
VVAEEILVSQILAFSGHRFPNTEKLGETEMLGFLSFLKQQLYDFFADRNDKYKLSNIAGFVCGGQIGFDLAAQQFAIEMGLPLHICLPYDYDLFTERWDSNKFRQILLKHMDYADDITIVDAEPYYKMKYVLRVGQYHVAKLQWRNQYMIDNSDATILYLDPSAEKGGTYNALQYCKKVNKPHTNMWQPYLP